MVSSQGCWLALLLKLLLFLMPTDVVVASSATSSGGCSVEVPDHGIVECGKSFDEADCTEAVRLLDEADCTEARAMRARALLDPVAERSISEIVSYRAGDVPMIPIGLWGDGVPCNSDASTCCTVRASFGRSEGG